MTYPDVVAISGSRRKGSYTRRALEIALDAAAEAGATTELLDLREIDLPPFDPDADDTEKVQSFKRRVEQADGILLGTPVYHGSYAATLKDALDHCGSDQFEDATVGLLATAGGGSYASTLDHLRVVVRTIHGRSIPEQVGIRGAYDKFDGDELTDDDLEERVRTLGREVARWAAVDPTPQAAATDSAED